jgi:hypothetical protein
LTAFACHNSRKQKLIDSKYKKGLKAYVPVFLRPTRATKPALIGATDRPEPHCKSINKISQKEQSRNGNKNTSHKEVSYLKLAYS